MSRLIKSLPFVKLGLFALVLNIFFGILFFVIEKEAQPELTLVDSIWWSMVTMTTVGYGDLSPITPAGRFFVAYPCMLLGIGLLGYLIGIAAEMLFEGLQNRRKGMIPWLKKNHVIFCYYPGADKLNRIINELRLSAEFGKSSFILLDNNVSEVKPEFSSQKIHWIKGDPTKTEDLEKAGIQGCKGVFILAADPENPASDHQSFVVSSLIQNLAKENNKKPRVVVELVSRKNTSLMKYSELGGVVSGDGILDGLLVQEFINPGVNDIFLQILTQKIGSQFYIINHKLEGKSLRNIQMSIIKHPTDMQLIGIIRNEKCLLNPGKDTVLQKSDRLIILSDSIENFSQIEKEVTTGAEKE